MQRLQRLGALDQRCVDVCMYVLDAGRGRLEVDSLETKMLLPSWSIRLQCSRELAAFAVHHSHKFETQFLRYDSARIKLRKDKLAYFLLCASTRLRARSAMIFISMLCPTAKYGKRHADVLCPAHTKSDKTSPRSYLHTAKTDWGRTDTALVLLPASTV